MLTNTSALSQGGLSLSDTVIGRVTLHPFINGNNLTVSTSGSTANLTWNNSFGVGGDGTSWDSGLGSNQNWNSTAASNPFIFFDGDDVTFNDSNNNHYTVNINTTVQPGSITVNNNNGNYTFNGNTIAGPGALTKSGTSALTINTSNSYSGGTTLNAGTLNLGNASALGTGTLTINAGTIDNTSGGAMQLSNSIPQVWAGNFTFAGSNSLDLGRQRDAQCQSEHYGFGQFVDCGRRNRQRYRQLADKVRNRQPGSVEQFEQLHRQHHH